MVQDTDQEYEFLKSQFNHNFHYSYKHPELVSFLEVSFKRILGMKHERIYGVSVVDSNNTDYPKLCSSVNASNQSEKYIDGPFCGTHEVKNGK